MFVFFCMPLFFWMLLLLLLLSLLLLMFLLLLVLVLPLSRQKLFWTRMSLQFVYAGDAARNIGSAAARRVQHLSMLWCFQHGCPTDGAEPQPQPPSPLAGACSCRSPALASVQLHPTRLSIVDRPLRSGRVAYSLLPQLSCRAPAVVAAATGGQREPAGAHSAPAVELHAAGAKVTVVHEQKTYSAVVDAAVVTYDIKYPGCYWEGGVDSSRVSLQASGRTEGATICWAHYTSSASAASCTIPARALPCRCPAELAIRAAHSRLPIVAAPSRATAVAAAPALPACTSSDRSSAPQPALSTR
jgi:hypothetical protein